MKRFLPFVYGQIYSRLLWPVLAYLLKWVTRSLDFMPHVIPSKYRPPLHQGQTAFGSRIALAIGMLMAGWLGATNAQAQSPGGVGTTGLKIWLKADAGLTLSGSAVSAWADQSGSGNTVSQATASNQPSKVDNSMNFNPALNFNSKLLTRTGGILGNAAYTGSSEFIVNRENTRTNSRPIWQVGTGWFLGMEAPWGDGNIYFDYGPSYVAYASGITVGTTNIIGGISTNSAPGNQQRVSINGLLKGTAANNPNYTATIADIGIGGRPNNIEKYDGHIGEVIIYSRGLTVAEEQRVNTYLGIKYGLTLAHNYLSGTGTTIYTVSSYSANVTGIGRDDASGLNQKQSKSINAAGLVTIGNGAAIATTNALNSNSFAADNSFDIIGDNGLAASYATAFVPQTYVSPIPSAFRLMSRIWKVQETGTVGTVTISVPATTKAEVLLVSNSATFTPGSATEITLTPDGNGNLTAQVNLIDGQFFTFGATVRAPGGVTTNMNVWLKADAGTSTTANGSALTSWNDQSPNNRTHTQTNATYQPKYKTLGFNFNPAVTFDGADVLSTGAFASGNEAVHVFAMAQVGDNGWRSIYGFGRDATHVQWLSTLPSVWLSGNYSSASALGLNNGVTSYILPKDGSQKTIHWNGASSNIAGTNTYSYNALKMGVGSDVSNDGLSLSENFLGDIAEVVIYKTGTPTTNGGRLATVDIEKIQSYLGIKYGTTLRHNYLAADGSTIYNVSSYSANIAGIGRDDAQGLLQKQSRSINTTFQPAIAVGSAVATSNALNSGTITTDASFMVWGSNSSSTSYAVNVTSPNVNTRMGRVWKVDKTNWTDQSVTIHINDPQAEYLLIQDSDPTFATITQEIALTSGAATINSSLLPDGAYFTFARQAYPPGGVATNLNFWIIAEDGSLTNGVHPTDGQQIEKVLDRANGGEAYNDVVGDRPTYQNQAGDQLNFHHTMRFDNGAFWKTTTDVDKDKFDNFAVFTVFKAPPASFGNSSLWGNADGSFQRFSLINGTTRSWCSPCVNFLNIVTPGNWYIASDMVDNTGAANATQFFTSGKFSGQVTNTSGFSTAPLYIARRGLITDFFYGDMTEVVVYGLKGVGTVMTAVQRKSVESYLALKYGITLDQSTAQDYLASDQTTKMWDATANGIYKNDIAGIGRDDFGNLDQRQSKSVNSDNLITIGIGSAIAPDNDSNTGSIPTNKSFLTWANNDGAISFVTGVTGATSTLRLGRVWKADKTNWSDQMITLCYAGGGNNRSLLISNSDPAFATFDHELPLDANGCVTFNSSLLPDGAYFTIGGTLSGPGCVNANLQLWLKAGEGVNLAFGTTIDSWFDQSLGGHQPETIEDPQQISGAVNFNPVVRFDGVNDRFDWTNFTSTWTQGEAFYMIKSNRATNISNGLAAWGNNHWQHYTWSDQNIYDAFGSTVRRVFNPTWNIEQYTIYNTMAKAGQWTAWNNGTQAFTAASNTVRFNEAATNLGFGNLTYFSGDIGEVILYDRELTTPEKQRVNTYLGIKYGQTLAHNYLAGSGTVIYDVSSYSANVTGIGRDDCQGLSQKQSKSVNSTAKMTIGLSNTIAATNTSNPGSFSADASFLIFGDNGVTTNALTSYSAVASACPAPPSADKFTNLNYKVTETGSVTSVALRFDATSFNFNGLYPLWMQVASDAAFTNIIVTTPMTFSAGIGTINYDFPANSTVYVRFSGNTTSPANICVAPKTQTFHWNGWNYGTKTKTLYPNYQTQAQTLAGTSDMVMSVTVSDGSNNNLLYKPGVDWWPVFGGWGLFIPRNDNNSASGLLSENNLITTRMKFLDKATSTSAIAAQSVDFIIRDIDGWFGGRDIVKVYGKQGANVITPKLSRYQPVPADALQLNYQSNPQQAIGSGIPWDLGRWAYLYVNFDQPVEEIYVEYRKDNTFGFNVYNDIRIGAISATCKLPTPKEPLADNVYLYKEVAPNPEKTNEEFTYKFTLQNTNCTAKTINLTDILPSGLTWVDSSFVYSTSLTVGSINSYGNGSNLSLTTVTVPPGTHYFYMSAIGQDAGTFDNQASYTVTNGTGAAYVSDDPSTPLPRTTTTVILTENDPPANLIVTKAVDKTITPQSSTVAYTFTIANPNAAPILTSFSDLLPGELTFVGGSLSGLSGGYTSSTAVSPYSGSAVLSMRDLSIPANGVLTFSILANTNSYTTGAVASNSAQVTPGVNEGYQIIAYKSNVVSTTIGSIPPSLTINSPLNNAQTSLNPTISGTATTGAQVVILGPGSTTLCTTTAVSGTYACAVSLSAGPQTLTAIASNAGGVSTPAIVSLTAVSVTAATGYNTYGMVDGITPAASPVPNPCFTGSQGIWQRIAAYKTGYTNGPVSGIAPGETSSESTFIVDIDNDGKKDIVWVFDAGNTVATAGVYIWKGNGDGTFATAAIKDVGTFTGNGVPNGTANVLAAGGTSATESTHIADMNGDGNLDLVWMFELTNSSYVWLGNGDGTFQHTAIYKTGYNGGPNAGALSIGLDPKESTFLNDIDNDGKIDIVWVFDAGPAVAGAGVYIWKGNGNGTFATTATSDLGAFTGNSVQNGTANLALGGITGTETTHLADFNGDGKADLLWAFEGTNSTYVWLGNGDGTFQHTAVYKTGYTGGAGNVMPLGFTASENTNIVDADGDGKLDIVWIYDGGVAVATAGAYIWRGNGDGTFATAATKDIGAFTGNSVANGTPSVALGGWASTESTHVTDLNNDGKVDLLWLVETSNSSYAWLAGCTQIAILSPANNTQTSLNPTISGTATPGSTVVILGPGSTTLCTTVATSGTYACPVSLSAGPQTLTAIASSANGVSTPATVSVTAVLTSLTVASSPSTLTVASGVPASGSAATAIAPSGGTAPLTYSAFNPTSGSATGGTGPLATPHGLVSINPTTGVYSYTPTPGYSGTDAVGIKVCDSGSPQQCAATVIPIMVTAPLTVSANPASLTAAPNTATPGNAAAALDPQGGTQPLTYSTIDPVTGVASSSTPHGTVSINPTTGAYTYTPTPGYSGTDAIGIKVCDSSTPPQCTTAVIPVTVSNASSGTLDCSTAQILGIVAGTPGSGVLKLTMTVSTTGSFPITISGSGLSVNPSPFAVTVSGTGLQTFYVPLTYSGAAFGPTTITVVGAGVCSPDMSLVTPKTVSTSVLNLGPACTPATAATLIK